MAKARENSYVLHVGAPLRLLPHRHGIVSAVTYLFVREETANFCFTFNCVFIKKIQTPELWGLH